MSVTPNDAPFRQPGHPLPEGPLRFDFVDGKKRLTTPLIRKNGELVEASWDEAIDLVASKMKETIETTGLMPWLHSARPAAPTKRTT